LYGQGLTELEACDCANLFVLDNSAMVEDFLEFGHGIVALMRG
jgi:hypothetical protein